MFITVLCDVCTKVVMKVSNKVDTYRVEDEEEEPNSSGLWPHNADYGEWQ